jgi:hypothetical protein
MWGIAKWYVLCVYNCQTRIRQLHSAGAAHTTVTWFACARISFAAHAAVVVCTRHHVLVLEVVRTLSKLNDGSGRHLSVRAGALQEPRLIQTMLMLQTALDAVGGCLAAASCGAQLAAAVLRVLAGVVRSCTGTAWLRPVGQL